MAKQMDLDFEASFGEGYSGWQGDRRQRVERIADVWGLPLNKQVRLKLVNMDSEFEGKLRLAVLPPTTGRGGPLTLRLGLLQFSSAEIERCTVV